MPIDAHLVAGGPDVDGLADDAVELEAEVVDATVGDLVVLDHGVGHEVPHADALHPGCIQTIRQSESVTTIRPEEHHVYVVCMEVQT